MSFIAGHVTLAPSGSPVPEEEGVVALLQQALELSHVETTKKAIGELIDSLNPSGNNIQSLRMTSEQIIKGAVAKQGYLWKRGKSILHLWSKRYYLLSGIYVCFDDI